MAQDIFQRVDTLWLGSIRRVQLGWHPLDQALTVWMWMLRPPPPNWLRQLTATLIHDDGQTSLMCRLLWKEFNRELLAPRIVATPEQLERFVNPTIIPSVPVSHVLFARGRRSRRLPNESSYKLRNGGLVPPDSSS